MQMMISVRISTVLERLTLYLSREKDCSVKKGMFSSFSKAVDEISK